MSDFEKKKRERSIFHCEINKNNIVEDKLGRKKAGVPSLTLAPEIDATFINIHI